MISSIYSWFQWHGFMWGFLIRRMIKLVSSNLYTQKTPVQCILFLNSTSAFSKKSINYPRNSKSSFLHLHRTDSLSPNNNNSNNSISQNHQFHIHCLLKHKSNSNKNQINFSYHKWDSRNRIQVLEEGKASTRKMLLEGWRLLLIKWQVGKPSLCIGLLWSWCLMIM